MDGHWVHCLFNLIVGRKKEKNLIQRKWLFELVFISHKPCE